MRCKKFCGTQYRAARGNPKWQAMISRHGELYRRPRELRGAFARDYTRILHCLAYRRLKHKTQVFFATQNDHVCTRMEHVTHVASVSYTIANRLVLNTELTDAIAIGHDLGHPPFGHHGEKVLGDIANKHLSEPFWHEKNSLYFVDKIETLPNPRGDKDNLHLTYAVRDGIACHCGEVDEKALFPRDNDFDLAKIQKPGEYPPYTWEGCVVKIADKISYLGRDIEDAVTVGLLDNKVLLTAAKEFRDRIKAMDPRLRGRVINTTVLMDLFINDLCNSSNPDDGLRLSEPVLKLMNDVKAFNYKHIYYHNRLEYFKRYATLIIESIFERLSECYDGRDTLSVLATATGQPLLRRSFAEWLIQYSDVYIGDEPAKLGIDTNLKKLKNEKIYNLDIENDYARAAIDYISGMTDSFAIKVFGELTSFE